MSVQWTKLENLLSRKSYMWEDYTLPQPCSFRFRTITEHILRGITLGRYQQFWRDWFIAGERYTSRRIILWKLPRRLHFVHGVQIYDTMVVIAGRRRQIRQPGIYIWNNCCFAYDGRRWWRAENEPAILQLILALVGLRRRLCVPKDIRQLLAQHLI